MMNQKRICILAISDVHSRSLWDYYDRSKLRDVDLIISCGDLDSDYLQFLVTMTNVPLLYVHGNHDQHYAHRAPEGCINIEDRVYTHQGIRILGLGGSVKYKDGPHQYSQTQMIFRMYSCMAKIAFHGGIDILVTHAPAVGINEGDSHVHAGFRAFNVLLNKYKPKYFLHGHVHLDGYSLDRVSQWGDTMVINAFESYQFDY